MNRELIHKVAVTGAGTPLVLLHGWGCDSASWSPLLRQLQDLSPLICIDLPGFGASELQQDFSLDAVVEYIVAAMPERCVLLGWSLGGMLAVQVAARYPQRVARVITLAANLKFVAALDYPSAMPLAVNRHFNQSFAADPAAALKLFSGLLAQGDAAERPLLKKLRGLMVQQTPTSSWLPALQLLAGLDNRQAFASLAQPGLHVLAEADALVPAAAAAAMAVLNPGQQVQVVAQTAHALHWSQPEKVFAAIANFLCDSLPEDDRAFKKRVAQSFSRAAHSYDSVATLQRYVGEKLLDTVAASASVERVLDLGCGTGYFSGSLQQKFPGAHLLAVDLAEAMLEVARARTPSGLALVCGDAEHLPLASASVDVIFSSLALQWCHNLPQLFSELHRVLKPGGQLIFSTLGPATLHELKSAWQQVDNYVHVNSFAAMTELRAALQDRQLLEKNISQELAVLEFASLTELMRELKALGAHNINRGQAEGLTGRKKILALKAAYENFRRENILPASYDVFYVSVVKAGTAND